MGWAPTLTWLRWSPKMLQHRKLLQPPFSKSKVHQFQSMQRREAIKAVQGMLNSSHDYMKWNNAVRRFAVAVVLNISFGIEIKDDNSPYIKIADDAALAINNSGAPASSIVDRFPASMCAGFVHPQYWTDEFAMQRGIFQPGFRSWKGNAMPTSGDGPFSI